MNRICCVADCTTAATSNLPRTALCVGHFESMRLEFLPSVFAKYPPHTWLRAKDEYEAAFGVSFSDDQPYRRYEELADEEDRRRGHAPLVYFIRWGDRCKIGTTTKLKQRVASLSLSADAVLLTVPGDKVVEQAFHRRFRQQRIAATEWFHFAGPVEDYIKQHAAET